MARIFGGTRARASLRRLAVGFSFAAVLLPGELLAQTPARLGEGRTAWMRALQRPMADRSELEHLAAALETRQDKWLRSKAHLIRTRLSRGDFRPGDRVYVSVSTVDSVVNISDTLTVGGGDTLNIGGFAQVPLRGLLRSELHPAVKGVIDRLYRNARVRTEPLIRVAVLEGVSEPGFYNVSSAALLSDLVMRAGGPTSNAALDRLNVKRSGAELYSAEDSRVAMQQQMTLDQLDIQSGDVVVIPGKRGGMTQFAQTAAAAASLILAVVYAASR